MMSGPDAGGSAALDQRIRVAGILVAAIATSVVAFAVVGTLLAKTAGGPLPAGMLVGIVSASFFALLTSVIVRRINYQPARLRQVYEAAGEAGLANHMLRTTIISAALAEAVAIFGLLLGMLSGDTYYLYALCAIALLGVLSNFPRAKRWRELSFEISAQDGAGAPAGGLGIGGAR
jgi:uncharacterized membrane protein